MESSGSLRENYERGCIFTAFDLETTGLDPQKDRIVEIGAVKFDNRGIIARLSILINPGIPMPPEAGKVNNITDEMLSGRPSLDDVFPDFVRFIEGTILTAHNVPFDCGFINAGLKERFERAKKAADGGQGSLPGLNEGGTGGFWTPPWPAVPNALADTLAIAKEVLPGLPSYKLQALAAALDIPARDAHRAEDDARVCMGVFIKLLDSLKA
jgi:DNA polymerase-3 subunit epsilon